MNKKDLIKYVSDKTRITEIDAGIIINVFLKGIKDGLENGERITLHNFGAFFIQDRKARTALDPRNGKKLNVPSKKVVKFRSSKKVFDLVNK
jgi:DNA-binding protein HU-beta